MLLRGYGPTEDISYIFFRKEPRSLLVRPVAMCFARAGSAQVAAGACIRCMRVGVTWPRCAYNNRSAPPPPLGWGVVFFSGTAGKTSLLNQFAYQSFNDDELVC